MGNTPTPATVAAYVGAIGPDHYAFRHAGLYGIVINSSLMSDPASAPDLLAAQDAWLEDRAGPRPRRRREAHRSLRAPLIVLKDPAEPDDYFNIPLVRRRPMLDRLRSAGVSAVMAGHYHRNAEGRAGAMQMITTGPVGKPLGNGTQSGMRVVIVSDSGLTHHYYALGELPNTIEILR